MTDQPVEWPLDDLIVELPDPQPAPVPRGRSRQYLRTAHSKVLDRHNESRFAGEVAVWERETGLDYEENPYAVRLPEEEGSPDADVVGGQDSGEDGDPSASTETTDPADPLTDGAPAPQAEEQTP